MNVYEYVSVTLLDQLVNCIDVGRAQVRAFPFRPALTLHSLQQFPSPSYSVSFSSSVSLTLGLFSSNGASSSSRQELIIHIVISYHCHRVNGCSRLITTFRPGFHFVALKTRFSLCLTHSASASLIRHHCNLSAFLHSVFNHIEPPLHSTFFSKLFSILISRAEKILL